MDLHTYKKSLGFSKVQDPVQQTLLCDVQDPVFLHILHQALDHLPAHQHNGSFLVHNGSLVHNGLLVHLLKMAHLFILALWFIMANWFI
jgi:hypothetical protein